VSRVLEDVQEVALSAAITLIAIEHPTDRCREVIHRHEDHVEATAIVTARTESFLGFLGVLQATIADEHVPAQVL
jgi:CMP-2-keto-3-deoxyoctulosonic acid synthetase